MGYYYFIYYIFEEQIKTEVLSLIRVFVIFVGEDIQKNVEGVIPFYVGSANNNAVVGCGVAVVGGD